MLSSTRTRERRQQKTFSASFLDGSTLRSEYSKAQKNSESSKLTIDKLKRMCYSVYALERERIQKAHCQVDTYICRIAACVDGGLRQQEIASANAA